MKLKSLNYFASSLIDPLWEVYQVLDNNKHPNYEELMSDLQSIDQTDLDIFVQENHIDHFLSRNENEDLGRRTHFIIDKLHKEIAKERILKLLVLDNRPEPYNFKNLLNLKLDKNHLISTNQVDLTFYSFKHGNYIYELCPIKGSSNSSYWIFQAILKCINNSKVDFKVRFDPFKEFHLNDYNPMMYKMHVHGKPLNWEKIKVLRNEDFGQWFDERENSFTDYTWTPRDDEVHFTCEEYPSFSYDGINTNRYFHAIFNKQSGYVKHCDGAIRVYNNSEITNRREYHVRHSDVRKAGKRIKIFQFDTKENQNKEISQDDFCQLAVNFFVWNHDVQGYFN